MALRDPVVVLITLHTTGGDHFSINPQHILLIDHTNEPTSHTLYVNDGVAAPTEFVIDNDHWLELLHSTPFVLFTPDLSPEA